MEYYLAIKKNEIMPFAATWMNPEIITSSEFRNRVTDVENKLIINKVKEV